MRSKIIAVTGLAGLVFAALPAHADGVLAQDGTGLSAKAASMVRVVRHNREDKDPLTKYGAGFYIVIFNKSNQPVSVGVSSIVVKDRDGKVMTILTDERLAEIRQKQAENSRFFGSLLSMATSMMANSAASHMTNAVSANNMVALGQMSATTVAAVSENNAQAIMAGTASLQDAYDATPFGAVNLPPLEKAGGRVLIEGMKDRDPAEVFVTIGDEVHEIDFAKGSH